jgi:heme oxygenase (biliverdin-IX-beta and delta-forming)
MILNLLKTQTKRHHEQVETTLDLLNRVKTIASYRDLLARFFGFYAPLELRLVSNLTTKGMDFDLMPRHKTPWLRMDLTALGVSDEQLNQLALCQNLPVVETPAQILGYLYVAEGSTLGGQYLARHFAQTLQLDETNGAAFFRAYGENTGRMWREFGAVITEFAEAHAHEEEIVVAAIETFETLDHWLGTQAISQQYFQLGAPY